MLLLEADGNVHRDPQLDSVQRVRDFEPSVLNGMSLSRMYVEGGGKIVRARGNGGL